MGRISIEPIKISAKGKQILGNNQLLSKSNVAPIPLAQHIFMPVRSLAWIFDTSKRKICKPDHKSTSHGSIFL